MYFCMFMHAVFLLAVNECWLLPNNQCFYQNVYVFRQHNLVQCGSTWMHATEPNSFMLAADLEKGLQFVTETDVKLNPSQCVIVNCCCSINSVVRSEGNYWDFQKWSDYCFGLLENTACHLLEFNIYIFLLWASYLSAD